MTGVPGGDVTLHAAITETLAAHTTHEIRVTDPHRAGCLMVESRCNGCGWRGVSTQVAAHQAERVMAVLADRLPHTPADQLATVDRMVGQRVHVERHAITHYEGVLERTDDDAGDNSTGLHAITQDDGLWCRVRSAGPVQFGGPEGETQYDVITPVPDSPPAAPEPRQDT